MGKFCITCGMQLDEDAVHCADCRAKMADNIDTPADATTKKSPKKGLLVGIIAGAAAVVLTLAIAVGAFVYFTFFHDTSETVVRNHIELLYHGNLEAAKKLAPQEYWDSTEQDTNSDDYTWIAQRVDEKTAALATQCGEDYEVTYKVVKERVFSDFMQKKIVVALAERYNIDEATIGTVKELDVDITACGSKGEVTTEADFLIVQIGNNWYPITYFYLMEEFYAVFTVT